MGFKRLKKSYRGRKKGDIFKSGKEDLTLKEFLAVRNNPSFHKRPLYIMVGHEVRRAVLEDGQVRKDGVAGKAGSEKRGYNTPQQTCPNLTPSKAVQRKDLAENIEGGTVLETHAGKGNLSKEVYSKKADKLVLVEKNEQMLEKADRKLAGVKHETVHSDNIKWLENEMTPAQLKNLKLVDFDPFGSPAEAMKAFFKNVPITHKVFVGVTDGSKMYLGYKKGRSARSWLKKHYGIDLKSQGTREDQIKVLDSFMQVLGRRYRFKVRPINAAFGKHNAVYAGYEITPTK